MDFKSQRHSTFIFFKCVISDQFKKHMTSLIKLGTENFTVRDILKHPCSLGKAPTNLYHEKKIEDLIIRICTCKRRKKQVTLCLVK